MANSPLALIFRVPELRSVVSAVRIFSSRRGCSRGQRCSRRVGVAIGILDHAADADPTGGLWIGGCPMDSSSTCRWLSLTKELSTVFSPGDPSWIADEGQAEEVGELGMNPGP